MTIFYRLCDCQPFTTHSWERIVYELPCFWKAQLFPRKHQLSDHATWFHVYTKSQSLFFFTINIEWQHERNRVLLKHSAVFTKRPTAWPCPGSPSDFELTAVSGLGDQTRSCQLIFAQSQSRCLTTNRNDNIFFIYERNRVLLNSQLFEQDPPTYQLIFTCGCRALCRLL